jgi:hypothetical protein
VGSVGHPKNSLGRYRGYMFDSQLRNITNPKKQNLDTKFELLTKINRKIKE